MPVVESLIRSEADGTISFGNYKLPTKSKLQDFEHDGDSYKIKTFYEITKLERNGMFVYESVPGTAVEQICLLQLFKIAVNRLVVKGTALRFQVVRNRLCRKGIADIMEGVFYDTLQLVDLPDLISPYNIRENR